mmetsp:Transcript_16162/g.33435  ORF Transcript_16162/g.33435 Transcript_16162/m.33435 type:complete len:171 (-) Transcript_16162:1179-1691(-)
MRYQIGRSFLLFLVVALNLLVATVQAVRVVTQDEMKVANGEDSEFLWLAVAGKVYDVQAGKDFYGKGGAYHVFAGRDGLVPYVTGVFTPEEASKHWSELEPKSRLSELAHWVTFYDTEDKYPLVGHLHGAFYDENGSATAENKDFYGQVKEQQILKKQKQEERKKKKTEL